MVTLPAGGWRDRRGLHRLIDALGGPEQARVVGGAVRDALLGRDVADIDVATRLLPGDAVARLAEAQIRTVPTGIAHGTVTALTGDGPVEVTTLRRDVETDGRHAVVAFTDDWQADAARRDFTVNALYADPESGEVFDWFGGLADVGARRIRFIGDPLTRIAEDHLRILRFFRFHAQLADGPLDAEGHAAACARANDLMALSRERIAAEWLKLLAAPGAVAAVEAMLGGGILAPVLPEVARPAALRRVTEREAQAGIGPDAIRRFAALLPADPALAERVGQRLRLSNAQVLRLKLAAARDATPPRADAWRHGVDSAIDRALLGDGDPREAGALAGWTPPRIPIGGGDLIARGIPAGPQVSATLRRIETAWLAADMPEGAAFEAIVERELNA